MLHPHPVAVLFSVGHTPRDDGRLTFHYRVMSRVGASATRRVRRLAYAMKCANESCLFSLHQSTVAPAHVKPLMNTRSCVVFFLCTNRLWRLRTSSRL